MDRDGFFADAVFFFGGGLQRGGSAIEALSTTFTSGEVFERGVCLEAVRQGAQEIALLFQDREDSRISATIEHAGRIYKPMPLEPTIARTLRLPTGTAAYGTPSELFTEMSKVFIEQANLSSSLAAIATCFCVSTWFTDLIETAPWLSITGPQAAIRNRLRRLLMCFCRRPLALLNVSTKTLGSFPPGWNFTIVISEDTTRRGLFRTINAARHRGVYLMEGGRLKDPRCAIVFNGELLPSDGAVAVPPEIACSYVDKGLAYLSAEQEIRIAQNFQQKLLQYRFDNFHLVGQAQPNLSMLNRSLRETGSTLMSGIISAPELIKDVVNTLQDQRSAGRSASWTDLDTVLVETLLFMIHEDQSHAYVGEVTRTAVSILDARGETVKLAPKHVAAQLRKLGVRTEPRDSVGYRYQFTQSFRKSVHKLAVELDVPAMQEVKPRCEHCRHEIQRTVDDDGEANVLNVGNV